MAVSGENQYIYGLHDPGGEHLLLEGGRAKGWVLVTEELGASPNDQGGKGNFYQRLAAQGLGVIVRLNHAYGPDGTIPVRAKYRDFAQRVANFVRNSPGAHIWIIGNEMNFEREQPRRSPGHSQAEPITPRNYADCYRLCRQAIKALPGHQNDQVVVGAIGPWNGQTPYPADPQGAYPANQIPNGPNEYPYHSFFGDYIVYLRDILLAIGRESCDAIAIHAYSHGYDPDLVFSNEKMGAPFQKYHYQFRTYRDQMNIIPRAFRDLPVYLTEANGDQNPNGERWPNVNRGWIKNAYREINEWNRAGNQQIRCMILYRWSRDDAWHIDGKDQVQQDLREAIAMNYQWDPNARPTISGGDEMSAVTATRPGYRVKYLAHNTPTTLPPGQTLNITLILQNAGSFTWVQGGDKPFRLGFQWYNAQGQWVEFPTQLDFRTSLPNDVAPGGIVTLSARLRTPNTPGTYYLRWDMIHEYVTWFTSQGDEGLLISPATVQVRASATPQPISSPPTIQIQDVSASLPRSTTAQYPRRSASAIRRLILHHTVTPASVTVQRIAEFQVNNRNLPGITYHYCVTDQGVVYQTQPLEVVSSHAGAHSSDSVGVCLIGDFTNSAPPQAQLSATAVLLAQLATQLGLTVNQIYGYSELVVTGSPGATWPQWRGPLLTQVSSFMAGGVSVPTPTPTPEPTPTPTPEPTPTPTPTTQKQLTHYLLFWYRGRNNWSEWDMLGAMDYIAVFAPTVGFSVEHAKLARYVTIVGGPEGVPATAEAELRAAGCQVGRVAGATETETRQMMQRLAAEGRRY